MVASNGCEFLELKILAASTAVPPQGAHGGARSGLFFLLKSATRMSLLYVVPRVAETWWDAGGIFACPDTDSFSARCQNREGHSPLAIHTAAFAHVLVLLAAGFALCFG
jgi:hypothetical protein